MKISIAARYRPFSHELGATCLLPGTCWAVTAFPALLQLRSLERADSTDVIEIPLEIAGPVREFTLLQDLEKGCIYISGYARKGRYQLRIKALEKIIELCAERAPGTILCARKELKRGEVISWPLKGPYREGPPKERLSFGIHRSQDIHSMLKRFDQQELLPILYHLSQWTPKIAAPASPMQQLLDEGLEIFLRAAFFSLFCPRWIDDQHQGLLKDTAVPPAASPCSLITDAAKRIRNLVIEQQEAKLFLRVPQEFHCGRMTMIQLEKIGTLDVEWSKNTLKKVILSAQCSAEITLEIPPSLRSFRMRSNLREMGQKIEKSFLCSLQAGVVYYLDRFQK